MQDLEEKEIFEDMINFIKEYHIYSFAEFFDFCKRKKEDWYSLLTHEQNCQSTYYITFINDYINSLRWEHESGYYRQSDRLDVDYKHGNIIKGSKPIKNHGMTYFIEKYKDVDSLTSFIIRDSYKENKLDYSDTEEIERYLLNACIFFLIDFCKDSDKCDFYGIEELLNFALANDEYSEKDFSHFDSIFTKIPADSAAYCYYKKFTSCVIGKAYIEVVEKCKKRLSVGNQYFTKDKDCCKYYFTYFPKKE